MVPSLSLMKFSLRDPFSVNLLWSIFWVGLALFFCAGVNTFMGHEMAMQFLAAYVLEKSLSIDNLFVFLLVFSYFKIPTAAQKRVLKWGIIGAVVMRGVFIFLGIELLNRFHWILYVFGAILLISGVKLFFENEEKSLDQNPIVKLVNRWIPVSKKMDTEHFWIREGGKWMATPLFLCLVVVELTDVIFAVDSVPAVLSVSSNTFIVYTSNLFAILGLRSLYFVLEGMMALFQYLHYGLGGVLVFIGAKMCLSHYIHISTNVSLMVILGLVLLSLLASLIAARRVKT